ncbi:MAG: isoleucine--tRNA ligase, partial [Myxococcales bacterium]
WSYGAGTALAEFEVEYKDKVSPAVYVSFALAGSGAHKELANASLVIWTTTPWTLPANLAVAVHPRFEYALVETSGVPIVLAEPMIAGLRERLGLGAILARFKGSELEGLHARHPWIDRDSQIVTADYVTLEAGTGCVHTAPGHGQDDYVTGQRYGLEPYAPVDASGRFTAEVPEFEGQFVFDADAAIVTLLAKRGVLLAREEICHSYPHCWRCKRPIIFRATAQWFLSMEAGRLRERALEEIDRVSWIPVWGRERIHGMIANRPDWCLSRQRSWGVPMIALRCLECGESFTNETLALRAADIFEAEGSDAWFTRPLDAFVVEGTACPDCGAEHFERDEDILDVWFDSGVSFSAVIGADFGEDVVADLYLEGSDQHRGWFHSALLTSVATRERAPYRAVLTHGFVLDGQARKMSKSVGNVIAPQKIIQQYGADILRLWVCAEDYRDDVRISEEILKRLADSYRRVRNTSRNLLGNLVGFDPESERVPVVDMLELDRWALGRLDDFLARCRRAYDEYEFHIVYHALNNFCGVDLSALYFDIVKDRLYCSAPASLERRSAQTVMYDTLTVLTRVIAPVLSFTADEIWKAIPANGADASVFLTDFPNADPAWRDSALAGRWARLWEIRAEVTRALEHERKEGRIGHSLDASVLLTVGAADHALLSGLGTEELAAIYIVSQVELIGPREDDSVGVEIGAPRGAKCGRCWNFRESVGTHDGHPEICSRCQAVVAAS